MRNFEEGAFEYFVDKLKDKIGLKADKTYVDNKVKTDVPENAKFTDTTYTAGDNITITDNVISSEGGGGGTVNIADNLTTNDATKALSAKQGKILNEKSPNKEYYQPHPTKTNDVSGNAEGRYTTASGSYSHAEGYYTTASGETSHAEGYRTTASGDYASHAEGYYTTASGETSHAEGYRTTASGDYASHAEGYNTTARGYASHAEGSQTTASGSYSHAQNERTIAQGEAQTAIGKYNIPQGADGWMTPDDHAFIIGNGTEYNRSNALAVNWNGDLDIAGDYKINGNVMVEPTITTAWEKFTIDTITASVAMSAPMGGGINLNVSAKGVFDWAVGDKIVSVSIVTDGAGTVAPELENPLTITSFEEMGFDITGTNASLYPVGDDFMPLIIGNTTHPQLGKIGAFATYGVDGTSVTVEVLRNPTVVYSDDADAYPDNGQVGNDYYIKMSPVRGLESRVNDLEARLLALENK